MKQAVAIRTVYRSQQEQGKTNGKTTVKRRPRHQYRWRGAAM
ncbi:hypothetical protein ACLBOM_34200 [Escherichia coli]